MAGLQVGQALRCSSYLSLGSTVPAPMFLGTQPQYATKALTLVFIATVIFATVAEVESGSTFRETCLTTEIRESFMKLTILHGATPAETCFAVPLQISFS